MSAEAAELPRSPYLDHTIRRARSLAEQRMHGYVTLEHLLLALLDDPHASAILQQTGTDVAVVRTAVTEQVNTRLASLVVPDGRPPSFSYRFDALMVEASQDAARLGRREVDGALAVIAIAKEPDGAASDILHRNGFNPVAALQILGGAASGSSPRPPAQPAPAPPREAPLPPPPPLPSQSGASPHGDEVDDVLASVRTLLEAGEQQERALPQPPPPRFAVTNDARTVPPPMHGAREAPSFKVAHAADFPSAYAGPTRVEPAFDQPASVPPRRQGPAPMLRAQPQPAALSAPAPAADFAPAEKERRRRRGEAPAAVRKALEAIPKKMRIGAVAEAAIVLSREDAYAIFRRSTRSHQQNQADQPLCRAVTVRMSAPEGGFFIEAGSPETQWLFNGQNQPADAFGRWTWQVIPSETGAFPLTIAMSARDIDAGGYAGDASLAAQTLRVRVRGSMVRSVLGLFRTLLVLLAGAGMAVAVYYGLKMLGKLP